MISALNKNVFVREKKVQMCLVYFKIFSKNSFLEKIWERFVNEYSIFSQQPPSRAILAAAPAMALSKVCVRLRSALYIVTAY